MSRLRRIQLRETRAIGRSIGQSLLDYRWANQNGFQAALVLLRAGAKVIVTSRFPADTLNRFLQEEDHESWLSRLSIYSADFRYLPTVDAMCDQIHAQETSIDVLINNAAQTVRRPPEYYRHLLEKEVHFQSTLSSQALARIQSNSLSGFADSSSDTEISTRSIPNDVHIASLLTQQEWLATDGQHSQQEFPPQRYDVDGQQIDKRADNSWVWDLEDVPLPELLEVHAVNALVPFLLIQRFQSLMEAAAKPAFIINVSAMEGHFASGRKTGFHPHTNMAKAAMNMITRTCSERFARMGIYMNSVDTGWVTNEYPFSKVEKMQDQGFEPPLDEIDGAARVLDPIFSALQGGEPQFGQFFKDYKIVSW